MPGNVIQGINLFQRLVVMDDKIFPIVEMFDQFGDETEVEDEVVTIVAGSDDFGWYVIEVENDTHGVTIH